MFHDVDQWNYYEAEKRARILKLFFKNEYVLLIVVSTLTLNDLQIIPNLMRAACRHVIEKRGTEHGPECIMII